MDTSTLTVQVQESVADTTTNTYTLANNYESINGDSKVFFLQETETGEFEIYFGWPRAILSAANSAAFICMGILVLVVGHLSDRFSPRLILSVTGLLFGFGVSLTALITEPFHLILIFCIFVGIGMSTHDVVTLSSVAKSFEKRLGIMTGITKVGTAMGQVCIPPFLAVLIFFFEWKQAIIILGLLGGILLLTAAYLMKVPEKKTIQFKMSKKWFKKLNNEQ